MSGPKIFVLQLKQLIFTALFVILGVVLIISLICMFIPNKAKNASAPITQFNSGIYTSSELLDNQVIDIEVKVSNNSIKSIDFRSLSAESESLFPLLVPTMNTLESQLVTSQNIHKVKSDESNQQTAQFLLKGIQKALEKSH